MIIDPDDLTIVPIVKGASNPSNFYELLPVHFDDAPHDFRIKQQELEDTIHQSETELQKTRLSINLLVDDLWNSKRIEEEVVKSLIPYHTRLFAISIFII
ncbi:hypothetical protein ACFLYL_03020 [Chloroflexota bacterium]